jgi:hypothetical protein
MLRTSILQEIGNITAPINYQLADPALDTQVKADLYAVIERIFAEKRAAGIDAVVAVYPGGPRGGDMAGVFR